MYESRPALGCDFAHSAAVRYSLPPELPPVSRDPHRIRVDGIDAPEFKQPFGNRSQQSLAEICAGKTADVVDRGLRGLSHIQSRRGSGEQRNASIKKMPRRLASNRGWIGRPLGGGEGRGR